MFLLWDHTLITAMQELSTSIAFFCCLEMAVLPLHADVQEDAYIQNTYFSHN